MYKNALTKALARAFFVLVPAMAVGLVGWVFIPELGLVLFVLMAGIGYEVTEPRPERGER